MILATWACAPSNEASQSGGGTGGSSMAGGTATPPADPIEAVQAGVLLYQGGDYADAITFLMASLATDPNGPAAPAAHYVTARSEERLGGCLTALAGYEMFLQSYPDDEFTDDAQFQIGDCHYETGNYPTALVELQKVLDDYAGSDAANDAQYTIGLCYYEQALAMAPGASQDELLYQARTAFQAAIDDYPERSDGTTSPWAQVHIGLTFHLVGACVPELAAMQKVISDYPLDPNDPSADPSCTATAEHLAACDVYGERERALVEADKHIGHLSAVMCANPTPL